METNVKEAIWVGLDTHMHKKGKKYPILQIRKSTHGKIVKFINELGNLDLAFIECFCLDPSNKGYSYNN